MNEIFNIILHEEKYIICVGNCAVSQLKFDTKEEAMDYIMEKPWELIGNLQVIISRNVWETNKKSGKIKTNKS